MRDPHVPRSRRSGIDRRWSLCLIILRKAGQHRALAVLGFGLLGFLGSMLVSLFQGVPQPSVHDEFAYLLAGETFAEGRLTNSTHPHWEHFETFHVLHEPTYQAKYPPGQGLLLAAGLRATGHPVAGVWLGAGLFSAAVAWALLVWLPPAWAVLTALFCMLQISWFSYWSYSYWGGAVAGVGGGLVFGSYWAMRDKPEVLHGILLGTGLGILASSRPLEGAIAGGLIASALVLRLFRETSRRRCDLTLRSLLPAGIVLGLFLMALGIYNHRVTGSVTTFPYQVFQAQYAASPPFWFQALPDSIPDYRHAEIERYWLEWGRARHEHMQSLPRLSHHLAGSLTRHLIFFLGPGLLALIGLTLMRPRSSDLRLPFLALVAVMSVSLATKSAWPHYVAPVAVVFYILMGAGLRSLHRKARRHRTANPAPVILVGCLAWLLLFPGSALDPGNVSFAGDRADLERHLQDLPGNHLVLVEYEEDHNVHREWVYNRADIDAAPVVWARAMGTERDQELRQYFDERTHWLLKVGGEVEFKLISEAPSRGSLPSTTRKTGVNVR